MKTHTLLVMVAALLAGFLAGKGMAERPAGAAGAAAMSLSPAAPPASPAISPVEEMPEDLGEDERRNIETFRHAADSVVFITSITLQRDFFSMDIFQIPSGTGSGFVWDTEGHIVTNYHVLEGGQRFSVTLADQSVWEAELTGVAPDKDLAVIRIEAPREALRPIPVGRSAGLLVGQRVLALGNPFGLDHSLTVGVVSALGRELRSPNGRTIRDVIQTDAAINPGNSGGPLLDSRGRLVGVNSAIYSPSGASSGIGFAVPVDTVTNLVPQIIKYGRPIRAGIGVQLAADSFSRRLGLKGVILYEAVPRGPAARAGLLGIRSDAFGRPVLGDVIVAVNGEPVGSGDDLLYSFERAGVGVPVTLTVERDGKRRDVELTLEQLGR
jgi:S1-C subfamily serine protease